MKETWSSILKSSTWLSLFVPAVLSALPEGERVVSGDVSISRPDKGSLQVQASDKAIINFNSFNIGKGESVNFVQPSKKAAVLNRVVGKDPSKIFGQLKSNGKVFLVNSNGVFFSPTAQVNVGSLIVSTLDIKNQDFLSDRLKFQLTSGNEQSTITNQGNLTAEGSIALLAPHVKNEGLITANAGRVVLASGEKITLDFSGDGLINFIVEGELKDGSIENSGSIHVPEGEVYVHLKTAQKVLKDVVNTDGIEEGVAIVKENGKVRILSTSSILARRIQIDGGEGSDIAVSGTLDASNVVGTGGQVTILGDQIALTSAHIDASGAFGGGTVLIGGDYQGNDNLHHSLLTTMDPESTIRADALGNGKGGKVILWSDGTTIFNGNIYAQAGSQGGDGGLVETSGKEGLGCRTGYVNTLALQGKTGEWFLDPTNITIDNFGTGTLAQAAMCNDSMASVGITPAVIAASASDVLLCITTGTITQTQPVTLSGHNLTYQSTGSSGNRTLLLQTAQGSPGIQVTNGNLTFNNILVDFGVNFAPAQTIQVTNGNINFTPPIGTTTVLRIEPVTTPTLIFSLDATHDLTFGGNVTIASTTGTVQINNARNVNFNGSVNLQDLTQNAGTGTTTFTGPVTLISSAVLTGTNFTIDNAFTATNGSVTVNNSGLLTLVPSASSISAKSGFFQIGSGATSLGGNITSSNGSVSFTSPITLTNNDTLLASSADVNLQTGASVTGGGFNLNLSAPNGTITTHTMSGIGALTIPSFATLTASGPISANSISITGNGSSTFAGAVNATGALLIQNGSSVVFSPAAASIMAGSFTESNVAGTSSFQAITTTGATTLTGTPTSNFFFNGIVNAGGAFSLNTAASATFSAALTAASVTETGVTGATSFQAITTTGNPGFISLTGTSFTFNGNVNTSTNGTVTINNSGQVTISAPFMLNGAFDQTGTGNVSLGANINTSLANGNISFASPVTLTSSPTLTAGTGDITFMKVISGNGVPNSLTIASAGDVSFTGGTTGGSFPTTPDIATLSITNTGVVSFVQGTYTYGTLTFSSPAGIHLGDSAGATVVRTTSSGITFPAPVEVLGNSTVKSEGPLIFNSTVDGPANLTLTSTTFPMTFNAAVGGTTPLATFIINDASTVTFNAGANLTALSVNIGAITPILGASTYQNITTTGTSTTSFVKLAAASYVFDGVINTAGPFSITGGTTALFNPGATLTALSITETGVTGLSTFDQITTTGTTTTGLVSLASGSYQFNKVVNAAGPFSINGGTTVTFAPGANLTAASVTETGVTGASMFQNITATTGAIDLTGTTFAFNGTVATEGSGGNITVNGSTVDFFQPVTTANGNVLIDNSGLLSIHTGAPFTLNGSFTQMGAGPVDIDDDMTATSFSFASPVVLTADVTLDATAGGITFSQTVDSDGTARDLNLFAKGDITSGAIGSISPLGTFTIGSAHDVTIASIKTVSAAGDTVTIDSANNVTIGPINAYSFLQLGGTGTTTNTGPWIMTGPSIIIAMANGIEIGAPMTVAGASTSIILNSNTTIQNNGGPFALTAPGNGIVVLNAMHGNVGSAASPIDVENGSSTIAVGAKNSAFLSGTIQHNYLSPPSVVDVPNNPACFIAFNGITIKNTCSGPVPPAPTPSRTAKVSHIPPRDFYFVGAYSIYQNLGDDYYFMPDFIHDYYQAPWSAALFYKIPPAKVIHDVRTAEEIIPNPDLTAIYRPSL